MRGAALALASLALAIGAPSAGAHDTYVDRSDGDDVGDTNDCRDPDSPCATLGRGIGQAGKDDTVFVGGDPAAFTFPQTLGDGKSIVQKDFSTTPAVDTSGLTILDTGADSDPALTVASTAGKVKGLYIRSQSLPLEINAGVTVDDVRFDETAQIAQDVFVDTPANSKRVTIKNGVFLDQTPETGAGMDQWGVRAAGQGKVKIIKGIFDSFSAAIVVDGFGPVEISKAEIVETHPTANPGWGILSTSNTNVTIEQSDLYDPDVGGANRGLDLGGRADVSGTLVDGYTTGVFVDNNPDKVILESVAVVTPDGSTGLQAEDTGTDDVGVSDVKATNVTISGDADFGLSLSRNHLRMDSSIVDAGSILLGNGPTCHITHSRGPVTGNDDCDFQTDADPQLANDGYHLTSDSPMIDKGDPDKPKQGAKDIDGDKRALDGTGSCTGKKRRDIGADEFVC